MSHCALPSAPALALGLLASVLTVAPAPGAEPVFSGPQVGEPLGKFKIRVVAGIKKGEDYDLVSDAGKQPLVVVFVHALTRPSIGLARHAIQYAAGLEGMRTGVCFLGGDATELTERVLRARHALPEKTSIGVSLDGAEGPGVLGLNRNVELTILVAKDAVVTANFALVQPSLQADGRAIVEAIAAAAGVKPPAPEADARDGQVDLRSLLSPLIQKTATVEEVEAAARKVEQRAAREPAVRRQVGAVAKRIVDAGKLENYGTAAAQRYLAKWAREFGEAAAAPRREGKPRGDAAPSD